MNSAVSGCIVLCRTIAAVVSAACVISPAVTASPEKEIRLETKIVSATIYSEQAQIVRRGEIELASGTFRIVCGDLPKRFIESSLRVEGSGSAEARITGIDFERLEKGAVDSPKYTEFAEELGRIREKHSALSVKRKALEDRKKLASSISAFSLEKAQDQLAREVFSLQDWKLLLDFFEAEGVGTQQRIQELDGEIAGLSEKMEWLRSELSAMRIDEQARKSVVIGCEVTTPGKLAIDISYLITNASWLPEYTVRYLKREKAVELTYNARISQATGEDWHGVDVLLSTAKPRIGAAPPVLAPHYISALTGRVTGRVIDGATGSPLPYANVVIPQTRLGAMTGSDGSYTITGVPSGSHDIKAVMMGYQAQELPHVKVDVGRTSVINFKLMPTVVGKTEEIVVEGELPQIEVTQSQVKHVAPGAGVHVRGGRSDEMRFEAPPPPPPVPHEEAELYASEFAANLQIKKPVDLETGSEPKRSLVAVEKLPGTFSLFAVPRFSEHVFVRGELTNALEVPLLAGLAEVYIETVPGGGSNRVSNFVGKERVKPVAAGQRFTMHLGIDQDITIEHKLDKKEYLSKSVKKDTKVRYHYVIAVENFKKESVELRIDDRIPVSTMKEIRVDDVEIAPEPAEQGEDGILTWRLPLAPGEKREIRLSYTIVYPGNWLDSYVDQGE